MMSKQTRKLLILLCVIELYFLLPLLVCGLSWFQAVRALRHNEVSKARIYSNLAHPFFQLSNTSYKIARPALWILQLSRYTDHAMRIASYTDRTAVTGTDIAGKITKIYPLILKKDKTADDQRTLNDSMESLRQSTPQLTNNMLILSLETQNQQIKELYRKLKVFNTLIAQSDMMGGNKKAGKFLVLFLNDKELRPGGGFIGSYGIITLAHYSLQSINIHDVYDADGQLKEHVDPPPPVREYLQNPHWFLRDSNFSPDFKEDAQRAVWFLQKETGEDGFDGVIGITTQTVQEIVGAYGEITLPDANITITRDNFYEKTQQEAEKNFTPGSRQKQNTLLSLAQQMMLNFDQVSKQKLGSIIQSMLTQKQIMLYAQNSDLQQLMEENNWAGRVTQTNGDFLMPVDANVGVNKSNLYVSRADILEVKLTSEHTLKHIYTAVYENTSPQPEMLYRNYFQLYIPAQSKIDTVLVDGQNNSYQVWQQNGFTIPTIILEVPPNRKRTVTIIYSTPGVAADGNVLKEKNYSLVFQKQIGSTMNDLKIILDMPRFASVLSKDFSAQVKGSQIIHYDTLDTDKSYKLRFTAL